MLEKQGILYGINVLDITIPPEEKPDRLSTLKPALKLPQGLLSILKPPKPVE